MLCMVIRHSKSACLPGQLATELTRLTTTQFYHTSACRQNTKPLPPGCAAAASALTCSRNASNLAASCSALLPEVSTTR